MQVDKENELNDDDDDWEYEEGPAEIIWQGNEIIVKKKRVRISKKDADQLSTQEVVLHLFYMYGCCLDYFMGCVLLVVVEEFEF